MTRSGEDEETFTQDSKQKHHQPSSFRLASHNKKRVAYFHDDAVGKYHYGVGFRLLLLLLTTFYKQDRQLTTL
jgi:hypothetical protein